MAKPKIFISSTHYDLKSIRFELEKFIRDQGYEPVLSEKGQIPYGSEERLEQYCYKEIENCDILISIIGGRYGSESDSSDNKFSISHQELDTAFKLSKQAYIFIEKSVLNEFRTYQANSNNETIRYVSVDDSRIFDFIDNIHSKKLNNQIAPFETTLDITSYLKEQWAGLFQSFLRSSARQNEITLIENLRKTASTLDELVNYIKRDRDDGDYAIKNILLNNHPVFNELQIALGIRHRIFFSNKKEFSDLMQDYRYTFMNATHPGYREKYLSWQHSIESANCIRVGLGIFDSNEQLRPATYSEGNDLFVIDDLLPKPERRATNLTFDDFDDDIPF